MKIRSLVLTLLAAMGILFPAQKEEIFASAKVGDAFVDNAFLRLEGVEPSPIYQKENYVTYHFNNLHHNFGNNTHGTCAFVSLGMVLSFYDAYYHADIVPNRYEQSDTFVSNAPEGVNFSSAPFDSESPGTVFETHPSFPSLDNGQYLAYVSSPDFDSLQFYLIRSAIDEFGLSRFQSGNDPFALSLQETATLLRKHVNPYYLYVDVVDSNGTKDYVRDQAVFRLRRNEGPLILFARDSLSGTTHSLVAYDCDEVTKEIYAHPGWRKNGMETPTHYSTEELGFDQLLGFIWVGGLEDGFVGLTKHKHSYRYVDSKSERGVCACNMIFPSALSLVTPDYFESPPILTWQSFLFERWHKENYHLGVLPSYLITLMDSTRTPIKTITAEQRTYRLNYDDWGLLRMRVKNGDPYFVRVEANEPKDPSLATFTEARGIMPKRWISCSPYDAAQYGFQTSFNETPVTTKHEDAIPAFSVSRLRCGFNGSYRLVELSTEIGEQAYIEWNFHELISEADMEMAWAKILGSASIGEGIASARFETWQESRGWHCEGDLLRDPPSPPVAPSMQRYFYHFSVPSKKVRLCITGKSGVSSALQRPRSLYLGNVVFRRYAGFPLSGGELPYEPEPWLENANCYAYALNARRYPGKQMPIGHIAPGSIALAENLVTGPLKQYTLEERIRKDYEAFNMLEGKALSFCPISKYAPCRSGCYKVAYVETVGGADFHWYRQNPDGYWSHKPGATAVTNRDDKGSYILDPERCDRGKYVNFIGYFEIEPWNCT